MSTNSPIPIKGIASINPSTGQVLVRFESDSDGKIEQKLQRAIDAFVKYRASSFSERGGMMRRAAEILDA